MPSGSVEPDARRPGAVGTGKGAPLDCLGSTGFGAIGSMGFADRDVADRFCTFCNTGEGGDSGDSAVGGAGCVGATSMNGTDIAEADKGRTLSLTSGTDCTRFAERPEERFGPSARAKAPRRLK